jgi:hypothetical protein
MDKKSNILSCNNSIEKVPEAKEGVGELKEQESRSKSIEKWSSSEGICAKFDIS